MSGARLGVRRRGRGTISALRSLRSLKCATGTDWSVRFLSTEVARAHTARARHHAGDAELSQARGSLPHLLRHDTLRPPIALGAGNCSSQLATAYAHQRACCSAGMGFGIREGGGLAVYSGGADRIARIQVLRSDGNRGGAVVASVDVSVPNAVRDGTVHTAIAGAGEQIAVSRRLGRGKSAD
jgi:hypothetical protein